MCMVHILYPIYLLKIGYIVEIVAHQALVYDYVNPLGGKGPFFYPCVVLRLSKANKGRCINPKSLPVSFYTQVFFAVVQFKDRMIMDLTVAFCKF